MADEKTIIIKEDNIKISRLSVSSCLLNFQATIHFYDKETKFSNDIEVTQSEIFEAILPLLKSKIFK